MELLDESTIAAWRENYAKRLFLDKLENCEYFPKYIHIETVDGCNSKCLMCPRSLDNKKKFEYMDDQTFNKIVSELSLFSYCIEMIILSGNCEPLLDVKLAERVKKLKSAGMKRVQFSTNASLLTEARIMELVDSGIDDLRVSLDGFTKETYEKIRRGLNYDIVKKNVLKLIEIREKMDWNVEFRFRMVELEENKTEREEWQAYWKSMLKNTDKVQFIPADPWGEYGMEEKERNIILLEKLPCISVFSSCSIGHDGRIRLCCYDMGQKCVLGTVEGDKANLIKEIWRGAEFRNIRNLHADGLRNQIEICRGCSGWSRDVKEDYE